MIEASRAAALAMDTDSRLTRGDNDKRLRHIARAQLISVLLWAASHAEQAKALRQRTQLVDALRRHWLTP